MQPTPAPPTLAEIRAAETATKNQISVPHTACKHRDSKTYICRKTGRPATALYCRVYLRLITLDDCHTCSRKET